MREHLPAQVITRKTEFCEIIVEALVRLQDQSSAKASFDGAYLVTGHEQHRTT